MEMYLIQDKAITLELKHLWQNASTSKIIQTPVHQFPQDSLNKEFPDQLRDLDLEVQNQV